jgi:hypothetical protein
MRSIAEPRLLRLSQPARPEYVGDVIINREAVDDAP